MKRFIQIGGDKELVEKGGWGEWVLLRGNGDWLAKQTITTLRHRIVVGEFIIPADAAVDLFNQDRDDGPFIVRIGGADIAEGGERSAKVEEKLLRRALGRLTKEEIENQKKRARMLKERTHGKATGRDPLPPDLFQIRGKDRGKIISHSFDGEGYRKGVSLDGRLEPSETKKPSQTVVLPDGTTAVTHSWIEFKDGQRFLAHVQIKPRKDVPPPANRPRGTWWQRAKKKVGELPGTNKDERFSKLVEVCEKSADMETPKPESQWWIDYLPDDHQNKEKNPRKLMVEFIRDWKIARATNDGRKEFRRKRTMWLMKQVERAQDKAGEGR